MDNRSMAGDGPPSSPATRHPALESVTVTLQNGDLWSQFHRHGTEMIITKTGRRMFPYLRLQVAGLNPYSRYFLVLELTPGSEYRYKYTGGGNGSGGGWMAVGAAEPQLPPSARMYIHPDSPATAQHWAGQDVLFNKVKLTNNTLDRSGNMVLNSMHKYVPTVHVIMASDVLALQWSPRATFTFPETEFMAVTAYQNENVTKLKIDNNPFAKGFREGGDGVSRSKKRKAEQNIKDEPAPGATRADTERARAHSTTDDSGVSSMGSPTPPTITPDGCPRMFSPPMPTHFTLPELPPYFPSPLWPYPYFLPPPPPLYPSSYYPYLFPPPLPPTIEPFLIDLSVKKETVTITN